jgi:eukaryotic-like serine/threonine-protein kinase
VDARVIAGRCVVYDAIARGGFGSVHLGRVVGAGEFSRIVAVKKLRGAFRPDSHAALIDEARLASRIHHSNVVAVHDVLAAEGELLILMDYVHGDTLARLTRNEPLAPSLASAVLVDLLHGLHAAHEAKSDTGDALAIVHRDVSPQNILVGTDGLARITDFGSAKAAQRLQETETGVVKGKLAYMAPEQLRGEAVDRRTDIFAAGVVLWELLTGKRLFASESDEATVEKILLGAMSPPSWQHRDIPEALDAAVMRALENDPALRFPDARAMALALEPFRAGAPAVGRWVEARAAEVLASRAALIAEIDREPLATAPRVATHPRRRTTANKVIAIATGIALVIVVALAARPRLARTEASHVAVLSRPASVRRSEASERAPASIASAPVSTFRHPAVRRATPPTANSVARAPDCKVPFDVTADGQKIYKRECL